MSIQSVPNTDLEYYLVAYDKDGRERSDDPDGLMSERVARAIRDEPVTDVFVMSHGWLGDIPGAVEQYDRWIAAMAGCAADLRELKGLRPNFKSLLVGFHWPSKPWGDEEFGMGPTSFAMPSTDAPSTSIPTAQSVDALVDQYAERIADTPRARAAIQTIVTGAMNAGPATVVLPPDMAEAYRVLNEESKLGAEGPAGTPGDDREPFDPDRAYKNGQASATKLGLGLAGPTSFGGLSLSGLLSPLRQLSFWKMKDRGRNLGQSGGFRLLQQAMNAVARDQNVRFHLMGHSFGCIVVTSMIVGSDKAGELLPRPVNSLTLVQGATSLWGFCNQIPGFNKSGYFRSVIEEKRVSGPILTTQSKRDTAVGRLYPIAAGIALQVDFPAGQFPKYGGLGAFGIQGPGLTLHDLLIGDVSYKYRFEHQHIYNLECSDVIKDGSGPSGAHNDIAKPAVAHAMWEAVKMS